MNLNSNQIKFSTKKSKPRRGACDSVVSCIPSVLFCSFDLGALKVSVFVLEHPSRWPYRADVKCVWEKIFTPTFHNTESKRGWG